MNTAAGLPIRAPLIHSSLVLSMKCFIDADIFPKRVGLPRIRASQLFKSLIDANRSPERVSIEGALFMGGGSLFTADGTSFTVDDSKLTDTAGTHLKMASLPSMDSTPRAISRAIFFTDPK